MVSSDLSGSGGPEDDQAPSKNIEKTQSDQKRKGTGLSADAG